MMKYCYDSISLQDVSVAEAIANLQAWKDEHPDAVKDSIYSDSEGNSEVCYQRPMNAEELELHEKQQVSYAEARERHERETYERLKAKYEGN